MPSPKMRRQSGRDLLRSIRVQQIAHALFPHAFEFAQGGGLNCVDVAHVPQHFPLDQLGDHRFAESFDIHRAA